VPRPAAAARLASVTAAARLYLHAFFAVPARRPAATRWA